MTLTLKASGRWKRKLAGKGKVKLELTVSFTATGSAPVYETRTITLKKTLPPWLR